MKGNVKIELEEIYKVCCEISGVDISNKNRTRETYVYGRACFNYASKKMYPKLSYANIGKRINRDHASVMHSLKETERVYFSCSTFNIMLDSVLLALGVDNEDTQIVKQTTRINKLAKKMQDLKMENERLKVKYQNFKRYKIAKLLTLIPEEKEDDFIETRIKPYLAMNGIKAS